MMRKRTAAASYIVLAIITAFLTFTATNIVSVTLGDKVVISKEDYEILQQTKKLVGIKQYIEENYVDGTDNKDLYDGALKGLFEALDDPYSAYFTKQEFKDYLDATSGVYGGIGIYVTVDDNGYITVVAPIEDTPGERAGLKTGDKIIKVDDKDVIGIELESVISLMKGNKGTKVKLTVQRQEESQPICFDITRDNIIIKSVKSEIMKDNIGYVRIKMFDEDTGNEFKKALSDLKSKNIEGLIIDLRNNPGGYVKTCTEVADELLDDGVIFYTEDNKKHREITNSHNGKVNVPFVILVDEGSASASEIVSGAVKDRKAGLLIGTKTFGKGLVQSITPLEDGSGFKLTTQKYYTPNGISINKIGIQPDIEIKPMEIKEGEKIENIPDVQLNKAIEVISGYIK